MGRCCAICGCCRCGISSGWDSGRGALPAIRWFGGVGFSICGMGEYRLLPGGYPPALPGRKFLVFSDLRRVVACKNVITKGLRPNYCRQTSYGCFPSLKRKTRPGPGLFLNLIIE